MSEEFSRYQKTVVYVADIIEQLVSLGVLDIEEDRIARLTSKGLELIDGFKPTDEEITQVLVELVQSGYLTEQDLVKMGYH